MIVPQKPPFLNHADKYYGWYIGIKPDSGDYFINSIKEIASQAVANLTQDLQTALDGLIIRD